MIDFLPSQVSLRAMFVGTFDRNETESTAAFMVHALALHGDTWRTILCHDLSEIFGTVTSVPGAWRDWFNNPFIQIDLHGLVDRGYAEWEGEGAVRFTEKGLECMRKWVMK